MAHQPTNPEDCFGTSLWGFGPWPFEGTDDDIKAWVYWNVLLVGGPIAVVIGEPHLDHDAGLEPDPNKYHPVPSQQTVMVDPGLPMGEAEWDGLIAMGILDPTALWTPPETLIEPEHLNISWATAQLPPGYPLPVGSCPAHPPGAGYGGVGYGTFDNTGTGYGLGSYGAVWFPAPEIAISGGYGGDPYGHGGAGSTEVNPPHITGATSLTGYEIEVFFSEEMDPNDPELLNPAAYTLTPVVGAPSTVTAVAIEKLGPKDILAGDFISGVTSVVITHTGTTLGGTYTVGAIGVKDVAGNPITGAGASLLTKGSAPVFSMVPVSGNRILASFSEDMLLAADYPLGAVETILSPGSYAFEESPTYPIPLTVTAVEHPYQGNAKQALLSVLGQTSLAYTPTVGPASVISYLAQQTPEAFGAIRAVGAGNTASDQVVGSSLLITLEGQNVEGLSYGFLDPGTRLVSGSSFRTDLTFDATNSFIKPAVNHNVVFLAVEDGTVEFNVILGWDGTTNQPVIRVFTGPGGFSQVFNQYDWTTGQHTISLLRNQKAGIAVLLWDGTPIFATAMANLLPPGAPFGNGNILTFFVSPSLTKITNFKILSLVTTASSTVFSGAWNFLHDEEGPAFVGNASLTKDKVRVARGPLVKGWGDGTPATKDDVEVLVNDTIVEVADVNPYLGEVQTVVPVPLMPVGQSDVKVNYTWMASPTMPFAQLNLPGLVLNKFDCTHGHHDPVGGHGEQNQVLPGAHFLSEPGVPKGAPDTSRYPMGLVLGPMSRPQPLLIGHRYMGFERGYSALLNSPTTLLLNQHPNRSILPGFEQRPEGEAVAFEGLVRPTAADPVWQAVGTDTGAVDFDEEGAVGTYTLKDENSGSYDPDNPQAAYYWRDVDLSFPSRVYIVGRWFVASSDPDGVFTGVGMGVHDGHHLYLAGCLLINGVEHVGLLTDATRPGSSDSWRFGPRADLSLASQSKATCLADQVPADLVAGDRFQILEGPQAGVFTCESVVFQTDGTVTLTVTPAFPAHWNTYGNKFPVAYFETLWSTLNTPTTYRLEVDPDARTAVLQASGVTTANITTINETDVPQLPQPAETSLLLPSPQDVQKGQAFWGSLSREATSQSTWSFFRYGVVPDVTSIAGHEVVVEAEMNDVPERDPNHDWMLLGNFGYSEVDSTADAVLLKQTSGDPGRNFAFAYARNEPWFIPDSNFDLTARFRVESGSGVQDAQIVVQDTDREIRLGTLLYREGVAADPQWRQLVRTPSVSLNGLQDPADQAGWSFIDLGFDPPSLDVMEGFLRVTQTGTQAGAWMATSFTDPGQNYQGLGGRVAEARLRVVEHTPAADGATGIGLRVEFGQGPARLAFLHLVTGGVRLETDNNALVQQYAFDWDDDEFHTFRLVADAENDAVLLYLDDILQLPTLAASAFTGGSSGTVLVFGQFGDDLTGTHDPTITSVVEWHSVSYQGLPRNDLKRTIGILRGSNPDDLNDWEIPRTDSSMAQNSRQVGPVIETMDWRSYMEVRLWRDPTWGVTVFRPDLPLPPYYQPEDPNVPGTGFATQITEPSAGWINVEYSQLPKKDTTFGRVEFGSLRKENVTQQRWERVRYRLFRSHTDDIRMPEHMVLNRFNVITSGEMTVDVGFETVVVQTLDDRRVTLLPTHMYADRIWKVVDGANIFTSEMFDFHPESQLIALKPDLDGVPRSFGVKVSGTKGTFVAKSKVFTADVDITGVVAGDILKIWYGEAEGSYPIEKVDIPTKKVWVASAFQFTPAGGDEAWSISQAQVPVTIVFVPGKPVTNTYLLNQPLLDGITQLNEGTPPVPKSQMAESERQEIWGSQLNNPNDLLNVDPEFLLNDPYRVVTFTNDPDSMYEGMEFMEVSDGEEGLVSFPCEATLLSDTPGFFEEGVGEKVYEAGGAGAPLGGAGDSANLTESGDFVGAPTGAHLLWFSGTSFWEGVGAMTTTENARVVHAVGQGGGMPGKFFFASGGNYVGPVVSGGGAIIGHGNPLGGTLGPGTTIFYPTYPSLPPRMGGGKIYRRTEWLMRLREVLVDGSLGVGQMLDETYSLDEADNTPPGEPGLWLVNPNGQPAANGLGAAFAVMSGSGDYSRYGPWGGMDALSPLKDSGVFVFVADPAPVGTVVSVEDPNSVVWNFQGVVLPANELEWAVAPTGPESLAEVLNLHPVVGQLIEASVYVDLSGEKVVLVRSREPIGPAHTIRITSNDPLSIRVDKTSSTGVLQGGAKMRQSSLLAGGLTTIQTNQAVNAHDPYAGMVASGGSPLPQGEEQHLVLMAV